MTSDRELVQMALDALDKAAEEVYSQNDDDEIGQARRALRARLAQPEPEPVVWLYDFYSPDNPAEIIKDWTAHSLDEVKRCGGINVRPLYLAPQREWQGLTAAERIDFINGAVGWMDAVCAIEAKLKEKNNGR